MKKLKIAEVRKLDGSVGRSYFETTVVCAAESNYLRARHSITAYTMFGPFRATSVNLSGLLWKKPWRLSAPQKRRQRHRLQTVDANIEALYEGLKANGMASKKVSDLMYNFPKESEMAPKDKYTVFNKHARGYRKGAHFVPKWTKLSLRSNPDNY